MIKWLKNYNPPNMFDALKAYSIYNKKNLYEYSYDFTTSIHKPESLIISVIEEFKTNKNLVCNLGEIHTKQINTLYQKEYVKMHKAFFYNDLTYIDIGGESGSHWLDMATMDINDLEQVKQIIRKVHQEYDALLQEKKHD